MDVSQIQVLESLVNSVTSEVGRAVVALSLLQLVIKSLEPEQSIRLHKSSNSRSSFSWKDGLPMRVLDKNFVTPVLRHFDLIRLNADGFMMTRSLAENYPYSILYKAAIKGAKKEWLLIVEWIESDTLNPNDALKYLIGLLLNKTAHFEEISSKALIKILTFLKSNPDSDSVLDIIKKFISKSSYSARLFEVAIHCLFQVYEGKGVVEGYLKPLSQMRSANKKHGNIGDVEITFSPASMDIIESWDAKYGKTYLREELEELNEKLRDHPLAEKVGFITDEPPNLKSEIVDRINDLEELHSVKIEIISFDDWVVAQFSRFGLESSEVSKLWLIAIAESICQKRRHIVPIDEPTEVWVKTLMDIIPE